MKPDNQPTTNRQPSNTYKNNKNEKNVRSSTTTTEDSFKDKNDTPRCPHEGIIDLYHHHLPSWNKVEVWEGTEGQKSLRTRCKEEVGRRQHLTWWEEFFKRVARSDYLNDRVPGKTFQYKTLEWLVKKRNFAKIRNGNFDNKSSNSAPGGEHGVRRYRSPCGKYEGIVGQTVRLRVSGNSVPAFYFHECGADHPDYPASIRRGKEALEDYIWKKERRYNIHNDREYLEERWTQLTQEEKEYFA